MTDPGPADGFTMYGARAAIANGLAHIEAQVEGIEFAVANNPGLAFDLARALVESACRTILSERSISFDLDDDLPHLFKTVSRHLPLLPADASGEVEARRSVEQTLKGLHTALQGVCSLRNAYGFASHGADGPRPTLESLQALLAAQAADTLIGFLYRVHLQDRMIVPTAPPLVFDDCTKFNAYLDEANEVVRIFELKYRPSEVLFSVDQDAYRELLDGFEPDDAEAAGAGRRPEPV